MFYRLTGQVSDFIIKFLRDYWAGHAEYSDLPPNIVGKYRFGTSPQRCIVVKVGGASSQRLSPDNFTGHLTAYCGLASAPGKPGRAVEWVREDDLAPRVDGAFPTLPGMYYCELTPDGVVVTPYYAVDQEVPMPTGTGAYLLSYTPAPESLRVYNGQWAAGPYTLNGQELAVEGDDVWVSYRHEGSPTAPVKVLPQRAYNTILPGVVMAFGKDLTPGDGWYVMVAREREIMGEVYGGQWDLQMDLQILARDVNDQRYITDRTVMMLLAYARPVLSTWGVEMEEISIGGESEEIYDETGDDYSYGATISLSLKTEWSMVKPLPRRLSAVFEDLTMKLDGLGPVSDPFYFVRNTSQRVG